jgi:hypothetical protein
MHFIQNIKPKAIARNTPILLAAITLGAALATDALAARHVGGGGGHGGGGRFGGGHISGGFGGGHIGSGFAGGRMAGDHPGGHAGAFLGTPGGGDFHGARMGGFHDGNHGFREHFGAGLYGYVPGYGDYGYDDNGNDGLGDYAGDTACFQYRHVHTTVGWQWRQVWVCN